MDFEAKKLMDLENRLTVAKGDGEGVEWTENLGCQLLPLEWISHEILLYSTENYI